MSARQVENADIGPSSPRNHRPVRASRCRDGFAECLSQRADSACLVDWGSARASARRRWPTEWRGSYSPIAIRSPPKCSMRETLRVDPSDPVARHIAAGAHGGLLVLERTLNDKGVMRTVITVDETRETITFFGSTAAVEGWRVCIVDTVDELNPNAANALLKILEEPPRQSLFLLVSHAPGRVLPTILSRCRRLALRPLCHRRRYQGRSACRRSRDRRSRAVGGR